MPVAQEERQPRMAGFQRRRVGDLKLWLRTEVQTMQINHTNWCNLSLVPGAYTGNLTGNPKEGIMRREGYLCYIVKQVRSWSIYLVSSVPI